MEPAVQQLLWHVEHPADFAPRKPGGAARSDRVLIPGAGTFEIVAGVGEFAQARTAEDVGDHGIGRVWGAWLAVVKVAVELLEGTAAHLDQLGVVRPPGPAIVLHHSTTPFTVVIN
jgi:hypothetical protein